MSKEEIESKSVGRKDRSRIRLRTSEDNHVGQRDAALTSEKFIGHWPFIAFKKYESELFTGSKLNGIKKKSVPQQQQS